MVHARWKIVLVLFLAWLLSYFDRSMIATALPFIQQDFGLSPLWLGFVSSAFFIGYAIMQVPGGILADRLGARRIAFFAIVSWSIFCALTGAATMILMLILVRILFGLAEGMFPPASWKALSVTVEGPKQARANSLMLSSNLIGPALAPLLFLPLIGAVGWGHAFWILSIPGILVAFACLRYLRGADRPPAASPAADAPTASMREALRNPVLWKLFLIWGTWDVTWWGFVFWLPSYLYSGRSFSLEQTGLLSSLPFLVGVVGMLVAGYTADRLASRRTVILISLVGNATFLLLLTTASSSGPAIAYLIGIGFFLPAMYGPFWSLPMQLLPPSLMGTASGFINLGGQIAGFIAPIIIGALLQATGGYTAGFLFMAACAAACFVITLTLRKPDRVTTTDPTATRSAG